MREEFKESIGTIHNWIPNTKINTAQAYRNEGISQHFWSLLYSRIKSRPIFTTFHGLLNLNLKDHDFKSKSAYFFTL